MSAVYCGSKRSYFEDIPSSKRFRCYSPSDSPIWSSPPSSSLDQLRTAFPHLELTVLVKALEEHGNDICAAMRSLHSEKKAEKLANKEFHAVAGGTEVTQSTGIDDAKVRASKVLEALEQALSSRAREEAGKIFQEEKVAVQQQVEDLMKDNTVLKRAVAIQHERQKAFEDANQQLELLKQVIPQYQEKIRNLEMNNYALNLRLQQAEQGNSMLERFNPDVY
ncbi:BnaC05g11050D [Brassica napus]|uniref:BnaC05g11050D protein n=1 Tax=Brassica napus TaxID=3708 RepID=A0A078HUT6_BRANA|nr:BnaC05g11050D [Brassica napus]